jgi:hypothetical protein
VAVLLNSRPWEGMTIMLPVGVAFVYWLWKKSAQDGTAYFVSMLSARRRNGSAILYYAWRITGNPLVLPYVAVHKAYSVVPLFLWQTSTPHYHHAAMQRFYTQMGDALSIGQYTAYLARLEQGREDPAAHGEKCAI